MGPLMENVRRELLPRLFHVVRARPPGRVMAHK